MKIDKCINCGEKPTIKDSGLPDLPFLISHDNFCYPDFMLDSYQKTKELCIKDWNQFNKSN